MANEILSKKKQAQRTSVGVNMRMRSAIVPRCQSECTSNYGRSASFVCPNHSDNGARDPIHTKGLFASAHKSLCALAERASGVVLWTSGFRSQERD